MRIHTILLAFLFIVAAMEAAISQKEDVMLDPNSYRVIERKDGRPSIVPPRLLLPSPKFVRIVHDPGPVIGDTPFNDDYFKILLLMSAIELDIKSPKRDPPQIALPNEPLRELLDWTEGLITSSRGVVERARALVVEGKITDEVKDRLLDGLRTELTGVVILRAGNILSDVLAAIEALPDKAILQASRDKLHEQFLQFRAQLERIERTEALFPEDAEIIASRIAETVPCTFEDSLFFAYGLTAYQLTGLTAKRPQIDLLPGSLLAIQVSDYQVVLPVGTGMSPDKANSAFALAESTSTPVSRDTTRVALMKDGKPRGIAGGRLVLDNRLGHLVTIDALPSSQAESISLARPLGIQAYWLNSPISMHAADLLRRHLVLVYPGVVLGSQAASLSPLELTPYSVLVGADNREDLARAVVAVRTNQKIADRPTPPLDGDRVPIAYVFRGRAALSLQIRIFINGVSTVVPVGTRLSSLVNADRQLFGSELLTQVRLSRLYAGTYHPVVFQIPHSTIFDIPLLKGDRIEF